MKVYAEESTEESKSWRQKLFLSNPSEVSILACCKVNRKECAQNTTTVKTGQDNQIWVDMHRLVQILYSTGTTSYPRTREKSKHYTACSTKRYR